MPSDNTLSKIEELIGNKRDAELMALFGTIAQGLADVVRIMESHHEPAAQNNDHSMAEALNALAAALSAKPAATVPAPSTVGAEWDVTSPFDSMGRPTGQMKIKRVK